MANLGSVSLGRKLRDIIMRMGRLGSGFSGELLQT